MAAGPTFSRARQRAKAGSQQINQESFMTELGIGFWIENGIRAIGVIVLFAIYTALTNLYDAMKKRG